MLTRSSSLVVPVKPPAVGKSRLVGLDRRAAPRAGRGLRPRHRRRLPRRPESRAVLVVTDDAAFSHAAARPSAARPCPDGVAGDLNAALRQAAAEAQRRWPDARAGGAVRRPAGAAADDLAPGARRWSRRGTPAFVADADGHRHHAVRRAVRPRSTRGSASASRAGAPAPPARPRSRGELADAAPRRRRPRRPARRGRARGRAGDRRLAAPGGRALTNGDGPPPGGDGPSQMRWSGLLGGLLGRCLLARPSWPAPSWRGLLGGCLLGGDFLAGAFLAAVFLAGDFFAAVFLAGAFLAAVFLAGRLLGRCLLGGRLLRRRLLGRGLLGGATSWRRLLGVAFLAVFFAADAAFLAGSRGLLGRRRRSRDRQLRQLLGTGDDVLQVGTRGELRHRRLLRLDPRAGLRVADPCGPRGRASRTSRSR